MQRIRWVAALSTVLVLAGCATLLGGGTSQPVTLDATPSEASYTVISSSGIEMSSGPVPATITLPRKNEYQVRVELDGYETRNVALTKGLNGWVWGNLVFGWIVGFAIDFISGSAYKLEPAMVNVTLERGEDVFAVVRLIDGEGSVFRERRVPMTPVR